MRQVWWRLVDFVVAGVCLVLMLSDWLDRRDARRVLARSNPYRLQEPWINHPYFDLKEPRG